MPPAPTAPSAGRGQDAIGPASTQCRCRNSPEGDRGARHNNHSRPEHSGCPMGEKRGPVIGPALAVCPARKGAGTWGKHGRTADQGRHCCRDRLGGTQ